MSGLDPLVPLGRQVFLWWRWWLKYYGNDVGANPDIADENQLGPLANAPGVPLIVRTAVRFFVQFEEEGANVSDANKHSTSSRLTTMYFYRLINLHGWPTMHLGMSLVLTSAILNHLAVLARRGIFDGMYENGFTPVSPRCSGLHSFTIMVPHMGTTASLSGLTITSIHYGKPGVYPIGALLCLEIYWHPYYKQFWLWAW